jgi:hypothetical protein
MFLVRILCAGSCCLASVFLRAAELPIFGFHTNDVIAFVGGSDVASARSSGHFEAMLAVKWPGIRTRNFGWEGDTVFVQRRDTGFPPTTEHVKRAGAKVVFLQFGRAEALDARTSVTNFVAAYEKLALDYARVVPHIILVTPAPFERSESPLPNLVGHNSRLEEFVKGTQALGARHQWAVVIMFANATGHLQHTQLTSDGLQFTPRGQGVIAEEFDRRVGFGNIAQMVGAIRDDGSCSNERFEQLRQLVIEKNRLWFNYWRPQNWAFLGGDRTTQPSSRDHRDPKVRWFPAEMDKYVPLIAAKEQEIEIIAAGIRGGK